VPFTGKHCPSSMTVMPEETDEDLELEQDISKVLLVVPDTCGTHPPVETWAQMEVQVQAPPSVEPVLVPTSNKPTICPSSSASFPISQCLKLHVESTRAPPALWYVILPKWWRYKYWESPRQGG